MSHTPGPWEWWTSNSLKRLSAGDRDGKVLSAYVARDGVADVTVAESDMALIAVAPELLEFVKDWLADWTAAGPTDSPMEAKARALIAKAEGQ
jgi:hypothetical protein